MDGIWFQELEKVGVSPHKIFAGNTLARRDRGRFSAKPPLAARSWVGVKPVLPLLLKPDTIYAASVKVGGK